MIINYYSTFTPLLQVCWFIYLFLSPSPSPATCLLVPAFWWAQMPHCCSYSCPLIEWLLTAIPPLPLCCRFLDWSIDLFPLSQPLSSDLSIGILVGANVALLLLLLSSYWMIVNCYCSLPPFYRFVDWLIDWFFSPSPSPATCLLGFWWGQLPHSCSYSSPSWVS